MIDYTKIECHEGIAFEDYLKLLGHSHSFLKSNIQGVAKQFIPTDKVRLGSLVDALLTEPEKADMSSPLYPTARLIAFRIKEVFGDLINTAQTQLSYTATMEMAGFSMQTKGRLDFLIPNFAVIDLKITSEKNVDTLANFMGYDNQVWHYARLAGVKKAFLLFYVVPTKKIIVKEIDVTIEDNGFWINKMMMFGTATEAPKTIETSITQISKF